MGNVASLVGPAPAPGVVDVKVDLVLPVALVLLYLWLRR